MSTNSITLRTEMVPILDEVYKASAKTSVLDSAPEIVRLQAGEFKIPLIEMDGLANHSTNNGGKYVEGNTILKWQTKNPTYDRNRKFTVDVMDNYETADVAFGRLAGEFIRTKVVPELDAVRIAKYASLAAFQVKATLSTTQDVVNALKKAKVELDEAEVPENERYCFVTSTVHTELLELKTTDSKQLLEAFIYVIVPQNRLISAVTLLDGKTAGQEQGGWKKANGAEDLNFLVVHKPAVIQGLKHEAPKHIPAAVNQDADGDSFAYRVKGIEEIYNNKVTGIYAHFKGTSATSFNVVFDTQGGSPVPSSLTVISGKTVKKPEIDPVLAGKVFKGWYTAATAGTAVTFPLTISAATTIYAQWE